MIELSYPHGRKIDQATARREHWRQRLKPSSSSESVFNIQQSGTIREIDSWVRHVEFSAYGGSMIVFFENEERFFDELLVPLTAMAVLDVLPIFASCSVLRLSGAI